MNNKIKGKLAEDLATDFLKNHNFKIIEKNFKFRNYGEIDIIAEKNKILNFIEVKSLTKNNYFLPEFHFNKEKFNKIYKIASFYANQKNYDKWIISLICVILKTKQINYYENVKL
jgi:putative endonuclease